MSSNRSFDTEILFEFVMGKMGFAYSYLGQFVSTFQESLVLQSDKVIDSAGRIGVHWIDFGFDVPLKNSFRVGTVSKFKQFIKS
jgi:hypothetical protein